MHFYSLVDFCHHFQTKSSRLTVNIFLFYYNAILWNVSCCCSCLNNIISVTVSRYLGVFRVFRWLLQHCAQSKQFLRSHRSSFASLVWRSVQMYCLTASLCHLHLNLHLKICSFTCPPNWKEPDDEIDVENRAPRRGFLLLIKCNL